jgi:hypothetical protein
MAHNGKWRRACGIKKSQECHNCSNKLEIRESKDKVTVVCNIGYGMRTLDFSRRVTPYCACWCESKHIKE